METENMETRTESNVWTRTECAYTPHTAAVVDYVNIVGVPGADQLAQRLVDEIDIRSNRVNPLPESLSIERVSKALNMLVGVRVAQVRGARIYCDPLYFKVIRYPAFMLPLLSSIGDIVNPDDRLEIRVRYDDFIKQSANGKWEWTVKKDAMNEVVQTLRDIDTYGLTVGLEMATAMPKELPGDTGVLTFVNSDDGSLRSHTAGKSPHHVLLRASLNLRFGEYVWGIARWDYGTQEWYYSRYTSVVRDSFRKVAA
jgi:hypothetical protein